MSRPEFKKAVQLVILNDNGEVLAVSRKDNHSDFGLVGGKVDPEDKDEIAAAIRETKEETGLDVFNLELIFAKHWDGYMGYTYLADYTGEIKTDEPHVVKWVPFNTVVEGSSFGFWNNLVAKSLYSMGVDFTMYPVPDKKYIFAVTEDKTRWDTPVICLESLEHWESNEESYRDFTEDEMDDINNMMGNHLIGVTEACDDIYEVWYRNSVLTTVDEIKTELEKAGFIHSKSFNDYVF
jgi:ADP-ribose pyrophosphatase YjhB (NUDIX family)